MKQSKPGNNKKSQLLSTTKSKSNPKKSLSKIKTTSKRSISTTTNTTTKSQSTSTFKSPSHQSSQQRQFTLLFTPIISTKSILNFSSPSPLSIPSSSQRQFSTISHSPHFTKNLISTTTSLHQQHNQIPHAISKMKFSTTNTTTTTPPQTTTTTTSQSTPQTTTPPTTTTTTTTPSQDSTTTTTTSTQSSSSSSPSQKEEKSQIDQQQAITDEIAFQEQRALPPKQLTFEEVQSQLLEQEAVFDKKLQAGYKPLPKTNLPFALGKLPEILQIGPEETAILYPWTTEEIQESMAVLRTIEDLAPARGAMLEYLEGNENNETLQIQTRQYRIPDEEFVYDPNSPFQEDIQRLTIYPALPKSLRANKPFHTIPEGFNRGAYVMDNITRFHSEKFPSDEEILQVMNLHAISPRLKEFFSDIELEIVARLHGLEFLTASRELQVSIRNRFTTDSHAPMKETNPLLELDILPIQLQALDGVLKFSLPQITEEQNNRMVIQHLKRKAELLTAEYNSDPWYLAAVRQRSEIQRNINLVDEERQRLILDAEELENLTTNDVNDDEKNELLLSINERRKNIDQLSKQLHQQQRELGHQPTINEGALSQLKKLPQDSQGRVSITQKTIAKTKSLLKNEPLIHKAGAYEKQVQQELVQKRENVKKTKGTWLSKLSNHYQLTKPRISQMVAATAMWGYWSVGNPTDYKDVALLTVGTVALSSSASIINQIRETDVDAKMTRTLSRPLVTGTISIESAKKQAVAYSVLGASLLTPLTTIVPILGLSNVALYGGIYTSLKRLTPLNTEIGALVGAIPPLMGYFAALNATQTWDHNLTAMLFPAAMMIAWQIQHVMLICVRRGEEYNRSGLVMQCKDDPEYKSTINKGIAWSVISTIVSAIPFFTGHADIIQLFATYLWAVYTVPYAIAMRKRDDKRLGQVLLAGYVVLGMTILFSLKAQIPEDAYGYLFVDGPSTPTPLPEKAPSLFETLFTSAGRAGPGRIDGGSDITPIDLTTATTNAGHVEMLPSAPVTTTTPTQTPQQQLESITVSILNSEQTTKPTDVV